MRRTTLIVLPALGLVGLGFAALAQPAKLTLDPKALEAARVGYYPIQVKLSPDKPAYLRKEPAYTSTPKYGVLHVGNGPRSAIAIALDEPANGEWRIYVDANANGDLTDDGDGKWSNRTDRNGRVMYGVNRYTVRASYGTKDKETGSADYQIAAYRFAEQPYLLVYRSTARTGSVVVDGKPHKVLLIENDADGLFDKPVTRVEDATKTKPVWLLIDLNDDGKWASGPLDIRAPFKLGERAYEAIVAPDGSMLELRPTTKPVLDLRPKQAERPPLLKAGTPAPDFTADKPGGGTLKLSDYRGKIVVLDFWATWCPPCQKSMPHLEEVHKAAAGKDVVVLAVCVFDNRDAYEQWMKNNQGKYTYQFAFDPAGRGAKSIARDLYNVSGIPTTYILDREGKVVEAIVGYSDGDKRIEEALKKLGVEL